MFKRSTITTINGLGSRFVLDSNLSKVEFRDDCCGTSMTFEKKAGKYIITWRADNEFAHRCDVTITASVKRVLSSFSRAVNRFDAREWGREPVCYDQHGCIANIRLTRFAEK